MKQWDVVYTQANGENLAALHLRRQGYEVYLPRYSKVVSHARYLKKVLRPLFQRYLFVSLDIETELWRSINNTLGVTHLVSGGEKPTAVPDSIVEQIQSREDDYGLIPLAEPMFTPGQQLVVVDGPLALSNVLFKKLADNERVVVLLELLGREVQATIPVRSVAAA